MRGGNGTGVRSCDPGQDDVHLQPERKPATLTDPNGNATGTAGDGVTTSGYERANRQTSIDYADSTPDVTLVYDNAGNRSQMTDGADTEMRTYDNHVAHR